MHLNSNQEGVVSEDTNPVPVKNVSKNDEIEMLENKMEEGAICYNDTADSLVEYCIEKEDVEKLETKNEDNTINNGNFSLYDIKMEVRLFIENFNLIALFHHLIQKFVYSFN